MAPLAILPLVKSAMVFSRKLSLDSLIQLCRVMRHNLSAGLTLRDVFRQQARKGFSSLRPVAERISDDLERGEDLQAALDKEKGTFPPLFLALAGVGERTGNLPEICADLERYYQMQQKLWRDFLKQIMMPTFQLIAGILVIAGMIFVLGMIADSKNSKPFDPLGIGLTGSTGAVTFLVIAFGSLATVIAGYAVAKRSLQYGGLVDGFLLRVPVVGSCLQALALARFCLALRLTLDTSLPIAKAVTLALRATGNAAFSSQVGPATTALKAGDDLSTALGKTQIFPEMFLNVLAVAEESGRVPEVMQNQTQHYEEEAALRMTVLTRVAGFGVWMIIAALIIIAIFRIFMTYIGIINQMTP